MTSLFSLSTNPLATPVGALIDRATDSTSSEENIDLFYEVCEMINAREENAKEAMKAIRKKLSMYAGRNWSVVTKTLNLLEICSANCSRKFLILLASKEFLQELKAIIGPKLQPPMIIQEKVLMMIKQWARQFEHDSDFKALDAYYQELRSKGVDFPIEEQRRDFLEEITSKSSPVTSSHSIGEAQAISKETRVTPQRVASTVATTQQSAASLVVSLNDEQIAKLNSELDVVECNIQVFNDLLNAAPPHAQNDIDLLSELNRTCKEMQARMTELIASITNEKIINELLRINDDLNNVFVRYSRFERQLQASKASSKVETNLLKPQVPTRLPNVNVVPKIDEKPLIDFGDENNQEAINARMASLSKIPRSNIQLLSNLILNFLKLNQAFNDRNTIDNPDAFLNDENEIKEMEQWLKSQGVNVEGQNEEKK